MRRLLSDERLVFAALFAAEAAVIAGGDYRTALAHGQWTAASVTLGIGVMMTLLFGTGGWLLGAAARRLKSAGERRLVLAAGVLAFAYLAVRARSIHARNQLLWDESHQALSEERARALASGDAEERRAVAANRSCPPELLAELSRSGDPAVRAAVAYNASTPPQIVAALAADANESVRLYASMNPARKR